MQRKMLIIVDIQVEIQSMQMEEEGEDEWYSYNPREKLFVRCCWTMILWNYNFFVFTWKFNQSYIFLINFLT